MATVIRHRHARAWYRRPSTWILGALLVALAAFAIVKIMARPASISYGAFLNQLDDGNVASLTLSGTELDGRFKRAVVIAGANGGAPLATFRSLAPDFGDPKLVPKLRKQHIVFGAASSSWLGAGTITALGLLGAVLVAKPALLIVAAVFLAGLVRVARGGKMDLDRTLSRFPMFRSVSSRSNEQKGATGNFVENPSTRSTPEEVTTAAQHRATRAKHLRSVAWILGAVLVALVAFVIIQTIRSPAATPYSAFLDQLDAGNVAGVTFLGRRIEGRYAKPIAVTTSNGQTRRDTFHTQIPELGDATSLLAELRDKHVAIDVVSSSRWLSWLGQVPWPMVILLLAILIVGLTKLVRRKSAHSESSSPSHPT